MNLSRLSLTSPMKFQWKIKNDIEISGKVVLSDRGQQSIELLQHLNPAMIGNVIAIDPGKNFGMAEIWKPFYGTEYSITLHNGVLDDSKYPLREVAYWFIQHYVDNVGHKLDLAIVEGASYGDRFGQVKLAEVRCGFSLGLSEKGIPVTIVAPKTPRKAVFGNGNIGAGDVWTTLDHNAADALCLALYPFYREGAK